VDLYAPTRLSPPQALAYDQYYPPELVLSPKGGKFIRGGTFETCSVQRFQQLDLELAPYEGLADKLAEQRDVVERLSNIVRVAEQARIVAKETLSKIERALKVAEKKSLFVSAQKHQQQLALAQTRVDAARDSLQAAEAEEQRARQQLAEPQRLLHELEVEGRKQQELTDEQTFILESLYGGPAKGDAKENAAEAEVQRLAQYGNQIEKALEQHKEAAKKLDSAVLNLERVNRAVEKLNLQLQLSEEQGTGSAFGYIQSGPLRNALQLFLTGAEEDTAAALALSRFMPLARSEEAEPGYVARLLAFHWQACFESSKRERREKELPIRLREAYRDLLESLQWQTRFVANIQADWQKNADALAKAKQALWDERVRLVYSGEDSFPAPPSPTGPLQNVEAAPLPGKTRLAKQPSWGKLARLISL
jgi:hypothetical protein